LEFGSHLRIELRDLLVSSWGELEEGGGEGLALACICISFEMDQISFRISLQNSKKTQISLLISFYKKIAHFA